MYSAVLMASMKLTPMTIVNEWIDRSALSTACRDAAVSGAPWAASRRSARIVNMLIAPTMISTGFKQPERDVPEGDAFRVFFKTG